MSTDRSEDIARALAVPDPRLADSDALWTSQTTWPEQSPRPGRPVDQGDSSLVLSAYGARETEDVLELKTTKAGSIDPLTGAGFAWREQGDALYRGRVAPSSIWGWDPIFYVDGSGSVTGEVTASKAPDAVTTSDGTVLVASQVSRHATGESIQVSRFSEGSSWATTYVLTQSSAPTNDFHPALCIVDRPQGERVILLYWVEDTASKTLQVAMAYSDDKGATWATGSRACLRTPIYDGEQAGNRLRAAYRNGQVVLFAELLGQDPTDADLTNNHIVQWASIDDGASFDLVKTGRGTESLEGAFPDVVATPTGFVLVFVSIDSTVGEPYTQLRRIPDAFTPFSAGPRYVTVGDDAAGPGAKTDAGYLQVSMGDLGSSQPRQVPGTGTVASSKYTFSAGDITISRADNGTLYCVQLAVSAYVNISGVSTNTFAENELVVIRSTDDGLTWDVMGNSDVFQRVVDAAGRPDEDLPGSNVLWQSQDPSSYLRRIAATWWRGRLLVAHQWLANPGNEDDSLCVLAAGGYSTVTDRDETTMAGWVLTWLPIEEPGDTTGWTATGAGTDQLIDAANRITTTSLQARYYENTDTSNGYIIRAALKVTTAGGLGSSRVAIRLQEGTLSRGYDVELRFSTTGIRMYDNHAAAQIGSDVSIDTTAGVEVVFALQDGEAAMWYRARSLSDDSEYLAGPSGNANDAGSGPDSVQWGTIAPDESTVSWYEFHMTRGGGTAVTDYAGSSFETLPDMSNPDDVEPGRSSGHRPLPHGRLCHGRCLCAGDRWPGLRRG